MSNIKTQTGKVIGRSLNAYHSRVKPKIDELKFKESYQGKIIDCMVGEVDDNYIETPETDALIVKLEHSKEGLVKIPTIKGKTILVDADGNETDTPAEGCKLVSVGEAEGNKMIILSKNKNLWDGKLYSGWVTDGVAGLVDLGNWDNILTDYIKVEKNQTYINNFGFTYVWTFDKNKKFIKLIGGYGDQSPKNVENAVYAIFGRSISKTDMDSVDKTNIQIERSTTLTSYVEPKCHKTEILLDEPLRGLSNEVCDEIIGNKLIKKTEKVLINTNNNIWLYENNQEKNTIAFGINNALIDGWYKRLAKSNIFDRIGSVLYDQEGFSHGDNGASVFIRINRDRLQSENLVGFKTWLSENSIEVIYELAEPIIEELPNGITLQGFDDTTMYIENSITPIATYGYNALIPYKQALIEQKEEVETNTLDIEQNIIPYLMDMEFNLMLMEDNE